MLFRSYRLDHYLKLLIRAKGDSDKGDNDIYIFNRRATISVNGKETNFIVGLLTNKVVGISLLLIGILGLVAFKIAKRKKQ